MPKNSSVAILKRWRAMDAALGSRDGLHVPSFARACKVSEKTVRRDLEAFRAVGQRAAYRLDEEGRYVWEYEPGVGWLFACNVPRRARVLQG